MIESPFASHRIASHALDRAIPPAISTPSTHRPRLARRGSALLEDGWNMYFNGRSVGNQANQLPRDWPASFIRKEASRGAKREQCCPSGPPRVSGQTSLPSCRTGIAPCCVGAFSSRTDPQTLPFRASACSGLSHVARNIGRTQVQAAVRHIRCRVTVTVRSLIPCMPSSMMASTLSRSRNALLRALDHEAAVATGVSRSSAVHHQPW
jgi:hypothetical protein